MSDILTTFQMHFLKYCGILVPISLKFVPDIREEMPLVVRHRTGDKPLPPPLMTQFKDAYMGLRPQCLSSMLMGVFVDL